MAGHNQLESDLDALLKRSGASASGGSGHDARPSGGKTTEPFSLGLPEQDMPTPSKETAGRETPRREPESAGRRVPEMRDTGRHSVPEMRDTGRHSAPDSDFDWLPSGSDTPKKPKPIAKKRKKVSRHPLLLILILVFLAAVIGVIWHVLAGESSLFSGTGSSSSSASTVIEITKQPTEVATLVGRDDAMIFSVIANGDGLTFVWEKYDPGTSGWNEIEFDGNNCCAALGIRLYTDAGTGTSQLWARDLTSDAFGTYRCRITDAAGTVVYSAAVDITDRAAS